MMHLSRLSEELILWSTGEFGFIELDDGYSTGSSIMPQKKNPDICELVRGKTGRVYGHLTALLTVMKGLPLAYDKDMQEDKEGVFDAIDTLGFALDIYAGMLGTMTVKGARTRAVLEMTSPMPPIWRTIWQRKDFLSAVPMRWWETRWLTALKTEKCCLPSPWKNLKDESSF